MHSVGPTLRSYSRTTFCLSPSVSKLITFSPTSWLLLPWQASPPRKVKSNAAHPMISTPHRLRTSETLMLKAVSSAVTHRCHHRPALPFQDWNPFTNTVLIWRRKLAQLLYLVVTLFCSRSRGLVLKPQSLPHRVK